MQTRSIRFIAIQGEFHLNAIFQDRSRDLDQTLANERSIAMAHSARMS